jgi:hypothetical protein
VSASASLLRECFPEIVQHLGRARAAWAPVVVEYLQRSLEASATRAAQAEQLRAARSERIRGAVRSEIDRFLAERPKLDPRSLSAMVRRSLNARPETYGLRRAPGMQTIREEISRREARSWIKHPPSKSDSAFGAESK